MRGDTFATLGCAGLVAIPVLWVATIAGALTHQSQWLTGTCAAACFALTVLGLGVTS